MPGPKAEHHLCLAEEEGKIGLTAGSRAPRDSIGRLNRETQLVGGDGDFFSSASFFF